MNKEKNRVRKRIQKMSKNNGITLVALVMTIIIIIILSTVSINMLFGQNGLITKAQIAKNETEVSTIKETLNLYYMNNRIDRKYKNPIGEKVLKEEIEDNMTLETILEFQYGVDNIEEIDFSNMYYLDFSILNLRGIKQKRYFMDTSTGIVFINEGIELNAGKVYVLEEKDIMPITLETQEIAEGFKLIATVQTPDRDVNGYTFFLNNQIYKEVKTNQNTAEIEVTDEGFDRIECFVMANGIDGAIYSSNTVYVDNYIIKTKGDFDELRTQVIEGNTFEGKRIRIVNDIDLGGNESNKNWISIGSEANPFSGTLEGNNHKLFNIFNTNTTSNNQGLFGVTNKAILQNIILESGKIEASQESGGIVGNAIDTQIINCQNKVEVVAIKGYAGGIAGKSTGTGKIENCSNSGNVSSEGYVDDVKDTFIGGVVGITESELVSCQNTGAISSVYAATGGVAGATYNRVDNCNNFGEITVTGKNTNGDATIGGVLGFIWMRGEKVTNCTNNGKILSYGKRVGGIVGITEEVLIERCVNNGEITSSSSYVGGIIGSSRAEIVKCHNTANIKVEKDDNGNSVVGGIVGSLNESKLKETKIESCYNTGTIYGTGDRIGGIVSSIRKSSIINSYNTGSIVSETGIVGGIVGNVSRSNTRKSCKY